MAWKNLANRYKGVEIGAIIGYAITTVKSYYLDFKGQDFESLNELPGNMLAVGVLGYLLGLGIDIFSIEKKADKKEKELEKKVIEELD